MTEPVPLGKSMDREEARRRTDTFKVHTEEWLNELVSLHDDEVWWALGYETWEEYCRDEFGSFRLRRGAERTEAIASLDQLGLSVRAIGAALGVGKSTVSRELQNGRSEDEIPAESPSEVTVPNGTPTPEIETSTLPEVEAEPEVIEAEKNAAARARLEVEKEITARKEKDKEAEKAEIDARSAQIEKRRRFYDPHVVEGETVEGEVVEPEPESAVELAPLRPIDTLITELVAIVAELERHTGHWDNLRFEAGSQSWYGPEREHEEVPEINPRKLRDHPFTIGAWRIIIDVAERLDEIGSSLSDAEDLHNIWPTMTATQKRRYLREMENGEDHEEYVALTQRKRASEREG